MQYEVRLKPRAEKDLARLPEAFQDKILHALVYVAENPYEGKKLVGEYGGRYSVRVWPYRIIYSVYKKERVVIVIRIGHRQGVY